MLRSGGVVVVVPGCTFSTNRPRFARFIRIKFQGHLPEPSGFPGGAGTRRFIRLSTQPDRHTGKYSDRDVSSGNTWMSRGDDGPLTAVERLIRRQRDGKFNSFFNQGITDGDWAVQGQGGRRARLAVSR